MSLPSYNIFPLYLSEDSYFTSSTGKEVKSTTKKAKKVPYGQVVSTQTQPSVFFVSGQKHQWHYVKTQDS